MSEETTVAVVIVGAGAGTRFGGPKAEATLDDGRRFLDAIVNTAERAGLGPIVAVLPPKVVAPPNVRVAVNLNPKSEQISSARVGLMQLTNSPVSSALLWPVDHPFVTLESVRAIMDSARGGAAQIVIPTYEGRRGHPAWFHRDTWRELMTVPDGGARAVIRADQSRVREVAVQDRGVVRDIDTKQDINTI